MISLRVCAAAAAVTVLATVGLSASIPLASATSTTLDCNLHTAWGGLESSGQNGTAVLAQIPVKHRIELVSVNVDFSTAAVSGSLPAFSEELVLVGVSEGPLRIGPKVLPVMPPDPNFAPLQVSSTGAAYNDNPSLETGVVAAIISKTDGEGQATDQALATFSPARNVWAGGRIWIRMGELGVSMDPEVQTVITYRNPGCS